MHMSIEEKNTKYTLAELPSLVGCIKLIKITTK